MSAYTRPEGQDQRDLRHERIKQSQGYQEFQKARQELKASLTLQGRNREQR